MNKFKSAAILAAGAALALSSAHLAAQASARSFQPKKHPEGIEVVAVTPGSAVEAFGFKAGDVIIEQDGRPINGHGTVGFMYSMKAGDKVTFKVKRAGEIVELGSK